jgi:hypothetical protein
MRLLLILFLGLSSFTLHSDPICETCDIDKVKVTQEYLYDLNFAMVQDFLCTLDESCKDNLEFSKLSNETLFDLVHNAPEVFLKVLQYGKLDNQDFILEELGRPSNAGINTEVIRSKIKKQDEKYMYKYEVLSALK